MSTTSLKGLAYFDYIIMSGGLKSQRDQFIANHSESEIIGNPPVEVHISNGGDTIITSGFIRFDDDLNEYNMQISDFRYILNEEVIINKALALAEISRLRYNYPDSKRSLDLQEIKEAIRKMMACVVSDPLLSRYDFLEETLNSLLSDLIDKSPKGPAIKGARLKSFKLIATKGANKTSQQASEETSQIKDGLAFLYKNLIEGGLVSDKTPLHTFRNVFAGIEQGKSIIWTGSKEQLHLFIDLIYEYTDKPKAQWKIVEDWFENNAGHPIKNVGGAHGHGQTIKGCEMITNAFAKLSEVYDK